MTEYERSVVKWALDRFGDIAYDANQIAESNEDPGLDGMIAGIKAVAENAVGSLEALLDRAQDNSGVSGV
jgi:hypothetical protein